MIALQGDRSLRGEGREILAAGGKLGNCRAFRTDI